MLTAPQALSQSFTTTETQQNLNRLPLTTLSGVPGQGSEGPHAEFPEGRIGFTIIVPDQYQGMAVSAALGVPVFASE